MHCPLGMKSAPMNHLFADRCTAAGAVYTRAKAWLPAALMVMVLPLAPAMAQPSVAVGPAPEPVASASADTKVVERDITQWLTRMHEAARQRSYVGTFVVLSASGAMASSRIWHACEGDQQVERIESLTGAPRSTFRRNNLVITFLPQSKMATLEKREAMGAFPNLLQASGADIPAFYTARQVGSERVAGFDADVVVLQPRDKMRFGYRVWSEKKSGLAITLQTLDTDGRILEQAAFSELDLDAPVKIDKLAQLMSKTAGYKVVRSDLVRTTAEKEGWQLKTPVPGFQPVSCHKRPAALGSYPGATPDNTMQWTFSDGLATVSLFVEPFDAHRHTQAQEMAMGSTQTITKRVGNDWWLTAVGEAPMTTLRLFAQSLERKK